MIEITQADLETFRETDLHGYRVLENLALRRMLNEALDEIQRLRAASAAATEIGAEGER